MTVNERKWWWQASRMSRGRNWEWHEYCVPTVQKDASAEKECWVDRKSKDSLQCCTSTPVRKVWFEGKRLSCEQERLEFLSLRGNQIIWNSSMINGISFNIHSFSFKLHLKGEILFIPCWITCSFHFMLYKINRIKAWNYFPVKTWHIFRHHFQTSNVDIKCWNFDNHEFRQCKVNKPSK